MPDYDAIEREWQWAERLGFAQGWVPETWTMSDRSYLEPWTLLAALAHGTSSLRLGTLVALLVPRHPTLLAGHVLTVDHVSKGRVELGIGAGDVPTDSGIFGTAQWSAGERVERLEDQLQLLDALLRGRSVTSTGRHYSVTGAHLPEPVQRPRPPLVVGARCAEHQRGGGSPDDTGAGRDARVRLSRDWTRSARDPPHRPCVPRRGCARPPTCVRVFRPLPRMRARGARSRHPHAGSPRTGSMARGGPTCAIGGSLMCSDARIDTSGATDLSIRATGSRTFCRGAVPQDAADEGSH